ncbi:hypothetical protein [Dyadobacter luticola]|uniref:Uncharacterized protein n=1 Tax=Dyadobacter luticola TaxID=1979387 RepID=A0A5R9KTH2_9BACT|nr:hypothetical protein [Dyadobacter luticola]TLU99457.1 hypothetical protein FEN17_23150 [Dyadobacter luticola]
MIRERGEPAIADTSKPIIEPPVFPDVPESTQKTRAVAQDPDLLGDEDEDDEDVDVTDEEDKETDDEFDDEIDDSKIVIEDPDDILNSVDDDDDDF